MSKRSNNSLYHIHVTKRFVRSNIEASSERQAEKTIEKDLEGNKPFGIKVEPIFEKSIGLEYNGQDERLSNNAVFELVVRGTDEAYTDKFAKALLHAIGGIAAYFENDCKETTSASFNKMIREDEISCIEF